MYRLDCLLDWDIKEQAPKITNPRFLPRHQPALPLSFGHV